MSLLRDLDEKYVPMLAEAIDRVARKFPKTPEPSGPLPVIIRLRRIDDRWANAGPLALLRDVPQLGAVLIGALVLANGVTIRSRHSPARPRAGAEVPVGRTPVDDEPDDGVLGPTIGQNVTAYLAEAKAVLHVRSAASPDGTAVAVVSFTSYRTPAEAAALVGTLQVRRIFFRPPLKLPQGVVRTSQVEDVVQDSKKAFARAAAARAAEAAELLKVAATIENDPAQKSEHEKDARLYTAEVRVLRGPCRCIYAVVVRARLRLLADLLAQPGVRAVDPGAVDGKLTDYEFAGLLPEEKVTVTGGNQAG